jgi:hypothetical protein
MSQLTKKIPLICLALLATLSFSLFINATDISQNATKKEEHFVELFNEETQLWGKANSPMQARIEFKEQQGDRVTLEGQVRSNLSEFYLEWKLPKGVRLVEGQLKEKIQQSKELEVHTRTIVIDVKWPLKKPHLVLQASEKETGESIGASKVFNLDPSIQQMEKQEIIRAHMKSRKIRKLIK